MTTPIIPTTYEEWKHCIVNECGIPLEKSYVENRISALEKTGDEQTKQFIRQYGQAHYSNVISWFKLALEALS